MPTSTIAVCLVGEIRSLVFPVVQRRLNDTLLVPLLADAFFVASRTWSRPATLGNSSGHFRVSWPSSVPQQVSEDNVTRIRANLPAIRDAIVADDATALSLAAGNMLATGEELRRRCAHTSERASRKGFFGSRLVRAELCLSRLVHAIRLRMCLALIERAEARRAQPYELVVRTRPDVWPSCVLTPSALRHPSAALGVGWAAFYWDYLVVLTRAAATTALRELALGVSVGACALPSTKEQCSPCLLRKHGFALLQLPFRLSVARHCQLIEDEKLGRVCTGFSGPPAAAGHPIQGIRSSSFAHRISGAAGGANARAPAAHLVECAAVSPHRYFYGSIPFANRTLGCDDDGGGGGIARASYLGWV